MRLPVAAQLTAYRKDRGEVARTLGVLHPLFDARLLPRLGLAD